MKSLTERLSLYIQTLRWLRVSQLFWVIWRRLMPPSCPAQVPPGKVRQQISTSAYPRVVQPGSAEFQFLNISQAVKADCIDWHPQGMPRLWRYNLHYFDFLLWDAFSDELKLQLIDDWIRSNPVGTTDAWEPYTVSLRVVNWIKYFDALDETVSEGWKSSLINQANWLASNLEYHILANHFLKNAKALIYAGSYFTGPDADNLLQRGIKLFDQEVGEQILKDGGHYERSIMYHSIVLEDILDIINIVHAVPELFATDFIKRLEVKALLAARFLEDMLAGDGQIPLFNDSAFGIAPLPEALLTYGQALVNYERAPRPPVPLIIEKAESGYFGYRFANDSLIIDCGNIAPDYQPGHTHCDFLSYELCISGQRFIIDTGTFGYELGDRRQYMRSTAAHNTIGVDGQEQSEIWGGFRVARRGRPTGARIEEFTDTGMRFRGGHDGYRRLPQRVLHERMFEVEFTGKYRIHDSLTGTGQCHAKSYIHFASDIELIHESDSIWLAVGDSETGLRISLGEGCTAEQIITEYFPKFGVCMDKHTLVLTRVAELPFEMSYQLERFSHER